MQSRESPGFGPGSSSFKRVRHGELEEVALGDPAAVIAVGEPREAGEEALARLGASARCPEYVPSRSRYSRVV
jgi:hypothetical protein